MIIWIIALLTSTLWIVPALAYLTGTYTNNYLIFWLVLLLLYEMSNNYKFQSWVFRKKVKYKLQKLEEKSYLLTDVFLEEHDEIIQIDHIMINKYGIFILEDREYFGSIEGDPTQDKWYLKEKKETYQIKNPLKKIQKAQKIVENIVRKTGQKIPVYTFVVFNNDVKVKVVDRMEQIITLNTLENIYDNAKFEEVDLKDVMPIYIDIKKNNKDLKKKKMKETGEKDICPICGGELLLFSVKKDDENIYYKRCTNYPRCDYSKKMRKLKTIEMYEDKQI